MDAEPAVRQARPADRGAIENIARRSLRASYTLSPSVIACAVKQWYRTTGSLEGDQSERLVLVATRDDDVVGYSEIAYQSDEGRGDIEWLHVDPDHRGQGIGSQLLERTRAAFSERGVERLRGRVLASNREGNSFYERQGFELAGKGEVAIDDRPYVENIYVDGAPQRIRAETLDSGEQVYVDVDSSEGGSRAPFHVVYSDAARRERHGYYCTNCESLATVMDTMGRIQCSDCGNTRTPTRWDAAYL